MTRRLISTGSAFEKAASYSRAVVVDRWCFVSGTTGYDYATMTLPDGVQDQTRNTLETIRKSLEQAGFSLSDVVRATYIVTDPAYAADVFAVTAEVFAGICPAATLLVAGLLRPEMKVEIEVTALRAIQA